MTTELELIYTIHNIVRGGEYNADDALNERLMRQFISIHRGKILDQAFKKGAMIPDECFQDLGSIAFTLNTKQEWQSPLMPKIIRFERGNFGIMAIKNGLTISLYNSEEFQNASKNKYNKYHPKIKFINNRLVLNLGQEQLCNQLDDHSNTLLNSTVKMLKQEEIQNVISLDVMAALVNPDDCPDYDWTSSPYPLSDELIENMINSVNAREFNLFLRVKSDETGDIRKTNNQPAEEL